MRIGKLSNTIANEYEMQEYFVKWLKWVQSEYVRKRFLGRLHFKSEVRVSEVGRVADFLLYHTDNQLINVEAKCHDFKTVLKQMDDHATYCDYSFAFIPDYALTPKWFKEELLKRNMGLIVYNYETKCVTEVFEAHHNKPQNRELRTKYIQIVKL